MRLEKTINRVKERLRKQLDDNFNDLLEYFKEGTKHQQKTTFYYREIKNKVSDPHYFIKERLGKIVLSVGVTVYNGQINYLVKCDFPEYSSVKEYEELKNVASGCGVEFGVYEDINNVEQGFYFFAYTKEANELKKHVSEIKNCVNKTIELLLN